MQDTEVMNNPYCAGSVRRYHTWPVIREQTVADHSFHVIRIYWTLFGRVPDVVTEYIVWHDMGELWTGDTPYPVKKNNYALKKIMNDMEREAVYSMGGIPDPSTSLTTDHVKRVKLCDLLEMLEYALHEISLGNQFATIVAGRIMAAVMAMNPVTLEMTNSGTKYFNELVRRYDGQG
jgi:5'-deoxynucleotidase YfbR-like HD superfamily hydrolase